MRVYRIRFDCPGERMIRHLDAWPAQLLSTALAAIVRRFAAKREPTITDMLSDSIVKIVMEADRVDPEVLEKELRGMAKKIRANPAGIRRLR